MNPIDLISNNQFAQGGLLLGLLGGLIAWGKSIPSKLYPWVKSQFVTTLAFDNTTMLYDWAALWFAQQNFTNKSRRLRVEHSWYHRNSLSDSSFLVQDFGQHTFRFKDVRVVFSKQRDSQAPHSGGQGNSMSSRRFEAYHFTFFTRRRAIAEEFLASLRQAYLKAQEEKPSVYIAAWDGWTRLDDIRKRSLGTLHLPNDEEMKIRDDLQQFFQSEDKYLLRGVPYYRGYLFYGLPGSGKTSLITALASEFNRDVYFMSLSSVSSDESLMRRLLAVPATAFLVLEDIDTFLKNGREKIDGVTPETLSFSALLNSLDGIAAKHGRVLFMTTNHIEKLDPALIRAGRVDVKLHFGYATRKQIESLFSKFYPNANPVLCAGIPEGQLSMADVQGIFLQHEDPNELLHLNGELTGLLQRQGVCDAITAGN